MRIRGRKALVLLLLLAVIGFAAYRIGLVLWSAHHYRAARTALERRDFKQASLALEKCLNADAGDLAARLLAAQTARRRGDGGEAVKHLQIYAKQGGFAEALDLERKLLQVQLGDLSDVEPLLTYCETHPDVPETALILEACIDGPLKALAPTLTRSASAEEREALPELKAARRALTQWQRLRTSEVDRAQGLVWQALIRAALNDQPTALADLRSALELDPASFEAQLYQALFSAERAPTESAATLQALHARAPENNPVRFALAGMLHNLGKLDEARRLLDEILAGQPHNVFALLERGSIAMDLQEPAEAERYFRRAAALAPDDRKVNFALASCLQAAGKADEAKRYQDRLRQLEAAGGKKTN